MKFARSLNSFSSNFTSCGSGRSKPQEINRVIAKTAVIVCLIIEPDFNSAQLMALRNIHIFAFTFTLFFFLIILSLFLILLFLYLAILSFLLIIRHTLF